MLPQLYLKTLADRVRMAAQRRPSGAPRIVVYTALTGGYDLPLPVFHRDAGVDYVLLTDRGGSPSLGWTRRPLPPEAAHLDPKMANRWCKFFPHRIFPHHDISVYIDANIVPRGSLAPLLEAFTASGAAMGLFAHPFWPSLRHEIRECGARGKFSDADRAVLGRQMDRYADILDQPMVTENGVIFRRNADPALHRAMEMWWQEMAAGVKRDQVSLPWVRHVSGVDCHVWPESYRNHPTMFAGPFPHFADTRPRWFPRWHYMRMIGNALR